MLQSEEKIIENEVKKCFSDNRISFGHKIGSGGFSEVYLLNGLAEKAVIKISALHYRKGEESLKIVSHRIRKLRQEMEIMNKLSDYPEYFTKIIKSFEFKHTSDIKQKHYFIIIQKFYQPATDYFSQIRTGNKGIVPESIIIKFGKDIAHSLEVFHSVCKTIHKDVKPSNCFVMTVNGEIRFLLGDFGNSPYNGEKGSVTLTRTPEYAPPDSRYYGYTYDIYMLGQSIYDIAYGITINELKNAGEDVSFDGLSKTLAEIIKKATHTNPHSRYHTAFQMRKSLEKCGKQKNQNTYKGLILVVSCLLLLIMLYGKTRDINTAGQIIRKRINSIALLLENNEDSKPKKKSNDAGKTSYLNSYKAPKGLGKHLEGGCFELEGIVYRLPCPVSEFTKNGWELDESNPDDMINELANSEDHIMKKVDEPDKYVFVSIGNFTETEKQIQECAVTGIDIYNNGKAGVTIDIPEIGNWYISKENLSQFMDSISSLNDYRKGYGMEYYTVGLENGGYLRIDYDTDVDVIGEIFYYNNEWNWGGVHYVLSGN